MESLEREETQRLWILRDEALVRLAELRQSFMQLRSGGCAMEMLVEAAQEELERVEGELRARGLTLE